ncbi:hypothetical protein GO491_07220 [Flavobacteriaceae bacterium Ap0902]|nr:hypothetical protein [Flavobacteriaceae bacterium Ap0902]
MKIKSEHNNVVLLCKSCKKELNIKVKRCMNCGDEDPFLFNWVEKISDQFNMIYGGIFMVILLLFIMIGYEYSWWWLILLIPMFIAFSVGLSLSRIYFLSKKLTIVENYSELLLENNHADGDYIWTCYIDKTLDL